MPVNLKLSQKALILVAVPLAFELAFVIELQDLLHQVERENVRERHVREVSVHLSKLLRLIMGSSVTDVMRFFSTTQGYQDEASAKDEKQAEAVQEEAGYVQNLVRGYPDEEATFTQLMTIQQQVSSSLHAVKGAMARKAGMEALRSLVRVQASEKKLLSGLDAFIAGEQALEQSKVSSQAVYRQRMENLMALGLGLNVFLAIALALYFNRGTSRRLQIVMDNTVRLAAGEPLNRPLSGHDEIAHLDGTFNKMARALAAAGRQDRAIVDKAMDVICSIDEKGNFTRVSPAAHKVWGYAPIDLLGSKYLALIDPRDQEATMAAFNHMKEDKLDAPVENRVVRQDGSLVDVLWSASWSEEDQTLFCVAHDITERKQNETILREAEARVRMIVESLPVGLLIVDNKGVIEFSNPKSHLLCGYSKTDLVGLNVARLFAYQDTHSKFIDELTSRDEHSGWELELIKKDGSSLPVEATAAKFLGMTKNRFILMVVDITERHEIERMRQEFLSMVSHDLRSPLASVQSFLDLLASGLCGDLNEKGQKKLAAADRNVTHLTNMIKDLLDVERAKSGKLLIFPCAVELAKLVEQSLDGVRMQAESVGINLRADVPDLVVIVDGERLVQVLINLLTNAIKFSPAGSAVLISCRTQSDWVEVRITDQGRGINPAHHQQIFERFQQVKASDAGYKGGTGLGLAICKAIVTQHGGSIGVDSEEGKGSSFWFRVPMLVVGNS